MPPRSAPFSLPHQVHRVLHVLFFALLFIMIRLWYLGVVVRDQRKEEAERPRHRVIIEPSKRGTIVDRYGIPLAINQLQYQATIVYSQMRDLPGVRWEKNSRGKRVKRYVRKEHIHQLAQFLGKELQMDASRIEDLIHSKAALYFHLPFVIKDDLTEQEYYRLKAAEKDWVGLEIAKIPRRSYPLGRTGGEIVGYMGAINRKEYESILQEIQSLTERLRTMNENETDPELIALRVADEKRLQDLEERAYSINDSIGKAGIEAKFEEDLRGYRGTKHYQADAKGRFLAGLPGSHPSRPGKKIYLTISAELQDFAENLLIQNEEIREILATPLEGKKRTIQMKKSPWIRGGAIVAMDPRNGEVIALASFPRFDPNDFIRTQHPEKQKMKKARIDRWFENESLIAEIWNHELPLQREKWEAPKKQAADESCWLNWQEYLKLLLPVESPLFLALEALNSVEKMIHFQEAVDQLLEASDHADLHFLLNTLYASEGHIPFDSTPSAMERRHLERILDEKGDLLAKAKKRLDPYFSLLPHQYDKVLLVDLSRVALDADRFPRSLLEKVGRLSISSYRSWEGLFHQWQKECREQLRDWYHREIFSQWREREQTRFLKQKRLEEKEANRYAVPYIDYLDRQERALFQEFWREHRWIFLLAPFYPMNDLVILEGDPSLNSCLQEWSHKMRLGSSFEKMQEITASLEPLDAQSLLATFRSYGELVRPLYGRYRSLRKSKEQFLEKDLASAFYPRYGYGCARSHAFRQATVQGSIFKIVTAYEALHQKYHRSSPTTLDGLNPLTMVDQLFRKEGVPHVGFTASGKPIPQHYQGGRLPRSHVKNMGTIDLTRAIERSSNPYFSLLASEVIDHPTDLYEAAKKFSYARKTGIDLPFEIAGTLPQNLDLDKTQLYAFAIGQGAFVATPLQSAVMLSTLANGGIVWKPQIVQKKVGITPEDQERWEWCFPTPLDAICLPPLVRQQLFKGMEQMMQRSRRIHRESLLRMYHHFPDIVQDFLSWPYRLIGKTSTSEVVEVTDLGLKEGRQIYSHVWFGGISFFEKSTEPQTFSFQNSYGEPELVVVVYLRYGGFGKEAAPLALQIAKKWKEIQERCKKEEEKKEELS